MSTKIIIGKPETKQQRKSCASTDKIVKQDALRKDELVAVAQVSKYYVHYRALNEKC